MTRLTIFALMFCAVSGWARSGAPPQQAQLKWEELDARIRHKKVALVLPDGTHVEGKVIGVQPDGLLIKGRPLIPRQSVSVLRATDYRKIGRLLGTTGAIAATAGILAAQNIGLSEGVGVIVVPVVAAAGTAGAGIGGYYVGKAFDKRVTEIRVMPDR